MEELGWREWRLLDGFVAWCGATSMAIILAKSLQFYLFMCGVWCS